jgi:hypothetical protein
MEVGSSLYKTKYDSIEYKDPPSFATISYQHCVDIVDSLKQCIIKAKNSHSNTTSIQKDYKHLIYYPENELKNCVVYKQFVLHLFSFTPFHISNADI